MGGEVPAGEERRARLLVADDNADMREYLRTLLERTYRVEVVPDGQAALERVAADPPDLVLADVMMPRLDGFGLLQRIREDPETRTLPVILVSARAGEEASIEGRAAGADDYVTKPFSARELQARVRSQLELARLRREAEQVLRHRGEQFQTLLRDAQESRNALEEADRRKDEFLAMLAHELRNPLAPIRNALGVLRMSGGDPEAAERVLGMMERQVDHVVRLVDDLMEVSRITKGKIELRKERADLVEIVRRAVETSRPLLDEGAHRLSLALPEVPLPVEADPVRIAQVLTNLLSNAAKYTPKEGRIWLSLERRGEEAVLSVRDDGVGIPPEMLHRVFDLFMQVERTYERAQGGLGIGLTLVRRLVELHGGRVEARSEGPGRGSEFVVWLPASGVLPEPREERAAPGDRAAMAGRLVLVVDDNVDGVQTLEMLLRLMGAEVLTATDGRQALQCIRERQPSVVLLDIGLPGMDGYEVARRARLLPGGAALTLIALTGWGQDEDRRRSREAGIDHHLVKPVDFAALESLLAGLPHRAAT